LVQYIFKAGLVMQLQKFKRKTCLRCHDCRAGACPSVPAKTNMT